MMREWRQNFSRQRNQIEQRYADSKPVSSRNRFLLAVSSLYRVVLESDILNRSAALSYTVAFSLVPLVTTSIAFLTAFPGLQTERDRLLNLLSSQLLPSAVQSVQSYITQFTERAAAAGAVSSLVFFIVVLMLFEAMESAFNGVWRVKKARTWGDRLRKLAVFFITGAIATTLFVIVQSQATQFIQSVSEFELWGIGRRFALASVFLTNLLVAWALFSIAYRVLPNTEVRWRSAIIAGMIVGTAWHFLKSGFTWYINEFANYKSIYGTLGAIPVFFLWVYLSFLLLLVGGYISFVAQDLRTLVLERRSRHKKHSRAFYAVIVAGTLARAFNDREAPLSAPQIADRLQIPVYFVIDALTALCSYRFALLVSENSEDRYIMARPSDSITVDQIVEQVAGETYSIPAAEHASPLHHYVEQLFKDARQRSKDSLQRVSIADVANNSQESVIRSTG